MEIVQDPAYHVEKSVLVLGMFDGVHIGHQVLLKKGRILANDRHAPLIVCTFREHPLKTIAPERVPKMLTSFEDRAHEMEKLGVDVLVAQAFTESVRLMPPEDYIGHLVRRFHPTDVVCGYNHSFGRNGEGRPAFLEAVGNALGFRTWIVPKITLDGQEVSSTEIRRELTGGNVRAAKRLLGRGYALRGRACGGAFSCAEPDQQLPAAGGYRCRLGFGERQIPCTALVRENGSMELSCHLDEQEAVLEFLCETNPTLRTQWNK